MNKNKREGIMEFKDKFDIDIKFGVSTIPKRKKIIDITQQFYCIALCNDNEDD